MRFSLVLTLPIVLFAAAASATPCPSDLPVLLIVQDKSGSMNQVPDPTGCPTCPTKWTSAKVAVNTLTNQFQGAFRFGVEMYPHDTTTFNCTTGTLLSGVPSTGAQVASAYASATPGGGTPTAASLLAAKSYLQSLNLQTPAYVLLITDGLPNCNLALDPNTCTASTPGCENDSCGLGAKDCLDTQSTVQAAQSLLAAGYKVYVVGFGSGATSGNNLSVLNGVAQAGGTGSAYSANDQAALSSALNAIGYNAATCCNDLCTQGAMQCDSDGNARNCVMDSQLGCTVWQTQSCGARSWCANGACQTCTDACTEGATQCVGGSAQECVMGVHGCTEWQEVDTCAFGELCQAGQCNSCQGCTEGATRCNGQNTDTCVKDPSTGCTTWQTSACTFGSSCGGSPAACQVCNATCTAGAKRCTGRTPETCVVDAYGCTAWQAGTECDTFCSGGSCGSCGTSCAVGDTQCNGSTIETCTTDGNGCSAWEAGTTCDVNAGEFCSGGARCESCNVSCTPGATRCSMEGIEECHVLSTGCTAWTPVTVCGVDEGCVEGHCVAQCQDACLEGTRKCAPDGDPLVCQKGPAGCTVWTADAPCTAHQVCAGGVCARACDGSDAFSCEQDEECRTIDDQNVCAPVGLPPKVKSGCACNAVDPTTLAGLGVLALAFARRRKKQRS